MNQIIKSLNQIGQDYIDESFQFIEKESLLYVINGANLSDTINNKKNTHEIVKALKWLELFWIYIEINFIFRESKRRIKSKNKIQFPNIFFLFQFFKVLKKKRINARFLELNGITVTMKKIFILNLIGTFIIVKT